MDEWKRACDTQKNMSMEWMAATCIEENNVHLGTGVDLVHWGPQASHTNGASRALDCTKKGKRVIRWTYYM